MQGAIAGDEGWFYGGPSPRLFPLGRRRIVYAHSAERKVTGPFLVSAAPAGAPFGEAQPARRGRKAVRTILAVGSVIRTFYPPRNHILRLPRSSPVDGNPTINQKRGAGGEG